MRLLAEDLVVALLAVGELELVVLHLVTVRVRVRVSLIVTLGYNPNPNPNPNPTLTLPLILTLPPTSSMALCTKASRWRSAACSWAICSRSASRLSRASKRACSVASAPFIASTSAVRVADASTWLARSSASSAACAAWLGLGLGLRARVRVWGLGFGFGQLPPTPR